VAIFKFKKRYQLREVAYQIFPQLTYNHFVDRKGVMFGS